MFLLLVTNFAVLLNCRQQKNLDGEHHEATEHKR